MLNQICLHSRLLSIPNLSVYEVSTTLKRCKTAPNNYLYQTSPCWHTELNQSSQYQREIIKSISCPSNLMTTRTTQSPRTKDDIAPTRASQGWFLTWSAVLLTRGHLLFFVFFFLFFFCFVLFFFSWGGGGPKVNKIFTATRNDIY